jgi:hypothetical protein
MVDVVIVAVEGNWEAAKSKSGRRKEKNEARSSLNQTTGEERLRWDATRAWPINLILLASANPGHLVHSRARTPLRRHTEVATRPCTVGLAAES